MSVGQEVRLHLICDGPSCGSQFRPARPVTSQVELRKLAGRQGWMFWDDGDFCSAACATAAGKS